MKTLYVIALIIACGLSLAAQEKVLTEAEYTLAVSRAEKSLYGGSHGPVRQIMETETTMEGRPETDYRLKAVTLIVPGQSSHRIEDRSFGGKPTKTESITIKERTFTRGTDGSWKEAEAGPRAAREPAKTPASNSQVIDSQIVFKYVGTEMFGERKVDVYTRSETKKTVNRETGLTNETEFNTKVRIGTDGKYLRHESNSNSSFSGKSSNTKILIEVAAEPSVKIEAPDVN